MTLVHLLSPFGTIPTVVQVMSHFVRLLFAFGTGWGNQSVSASRRL